jgi:hypothetical protein
LLYNLDITASSLASFAAIASSSSSSPCAIIVGSTSAVEVEDPFATKKRATHRTWGNKRASVVSRIETWPALENAKSITDATPASKMCIAKI